MKKWDFWYLTYSRFCCNSLGSDKAAELYLCASGWWEVRVLGILIYCSSAVCSSPDTGTPQCDELVLGSEKNDLIGTNEVRKRERNTQREKCWGRKKAVGDSGTDKEIEDGNNSLSLETNEANLNLSLLPSSFCLVWPLPRPASALHNQFNLFRLIRLPDALPLCLLPFSLSPIHRSLLLTRTKADFFPWRMGSVNARPKKLCQIFCLHSKSQRGGRFTQGHVWHFMLEWVGELGFRVLTVIFGVFVNAWI